MGLLMNKCGATDCHGVAISKGYCRKHYQRFKAHGDANFLKKKSNTKWNIRIDENNCFLVTTHKGNAYGYPRINIGGKDVLIHRLVYKEMYGEIKGGLFIRHKCDIRMCVNPEHLIIGNHKENMKDMTDRKRQAKGIKNGRAKLTESEVLEIRSIYPELSYEKLAKKYNVSRFVTYAVVKRKTWKHI